MKIAYCFYGHLRTYEKCYPTFKKYLFDLAPGDIYMHTWHTASNLKDTWWSGQDKELATQRINVESVSELYKPEGFVMETQANLFFPTHEDFDKVSPYPATQLYYPWYSMRFSIQLAQASGYYDRFISLRPDTLFRAPLDLKELEDENTLYLNRNDYQTINGRKSDIFWHGNQRNARLYTNWINYFHEFLIPFPGSTPEEGFTRYIDTLKIPCKLSSVKFDLLRLGGNLMQISQEIGAL